MADQQPHLTDLAPDELAIELDGKDVHPDSVDTGRTLEFVAAMLELIGNVAKLDGRELTFSGLAIRDKCAQVVVRTSDGERARNASMTTLAILARDETDLDVDQIWSLQPLVERVQRAVRGLPDGQIPSLQVRNDKAVVHIDTSPPPTMPTSVVILRAIPQRSGGVDPKVRFSAFAERDAFSLDVTPEQARQIGAHLYHELEIEAQVVRLLDGRIVSGKLIEFHPLDRGDSLALWQAWYRENAAHFEDVDDIEAELGRD